VDVVNVTKFVGLGDALTSLRNESFVHCDLMILPNISNGTNLWLCLDTQNTKGIQIQRASISNGTNLWFPLPSDPHWGLCPVDPAGGFAPMLQL